MNDTDVESKRVFTVKLLGSKMIARESRDYSGEWWNCTAVLSGKFDPSPTVDCEQAWMGMRGCTERRPCDACYDRQEWEDGFLGVVVASTDWSLYEFYRGPGRQFAHSPLVYQRGSRVVVSWSGGLDV